MSPREDTTSRTEAAAADYAQILGASEAIGGGVRDQEPWAVHSSPLGPDPWLPFTCPKCGDDDPHGMPETCTCCGWRNYG